MKLGRIIGSVMCTAKDGAGRGEAAAAAAGGRGRPGHGEAVVAFDTVQAGPGDLVFFEGGREAAQALTDWFNTSDATVMAIVDRVDA